MACLQVLDLRLHPGCEHLAREERRACATSGVLPAVLLAEKVWTVGSSMHADAFLNSVSMQQRRETHVRTMLTGTKHAHTFAPA